MACNNPINSLDKQNGIGLDALPVNSVPCRLPSRDPGSLKWSVKTRTDDNRQSGKSCHQGLNGWPQQCLEHHKTAWPVWK